MATDFGKPKNRNFEVKSKNCYCELKRLSSCPIIKPNKKEKLTLEVI